MKLKTLALAAGLACATGAIAAPTQWSSASGGNDHWYEFISPSATWQNAFTAANASTFMGMNGYLATVTSAAENTFIANLANGTLAWLGGSDAGNAVNVWTWRNGPEAGHAFTYTHWNGGEPNNCCGGEDYLQINWAVRGGWNDHGGPGNGYQMNGYIVEYSAAPVPEPETYAMLLAGLGLMGGIARRRKAARA